MAKKKKNAWIGWLVAIIVGIVSLITGKSWTDWEITQEVIQESNKQADTERMEIPIMKQKQGQIIQRTGYTLSYDAKNKTPQWVAWELTKEETRGNEERSTEFFPDPDVIGTKVVTYDYSHSGYDRGHMAPAGDMKWNKKAMEESFYMTNICPQNHNLNAGVWSTLEQQCRRWAETGTTVYIACGPILDSSRKAQYIGDKHRVRVPEAFFKVVLYGLETSHPKAYGFVFENKAGKKPLTHYARTVDEIELLTGYDFFTTLDDAFEQQIEAAKFDL